MANLFEQEQQAIYEREVRYREQMRKDGDHQADFLTPAIPSQVDWRDVIDADYHDEIDYDEIEDAPDGEDV